MVKSTKGVKTRIHKKEHSLFVQANSCHSMILMATGKSLEYPETKEMVKLIDVQTKLTKWKKKSSNYFLTCEVTYIRPWLQFTLWRTAKATIGPSQSCRRSHLSYKPTNTISPVNWSTFRIFHFEITLSNLTEDASIHRATNPYSQLK